ncbi:unnamed protein product [Ectocarpus sp. 13 AM-2016]
MLLAARVLSRTTAAATAAVAVCFNRPMLSSPSPLAAQQRGLVEAEEQEKICERRITKHDVPVVKLHQAVREGHLHHVEDVLQQHQPGTATAVSSLNENGDACIHVAAKLGHAEIVSLLLHHGAEKDGVGSGSRTPLHLASVFGHQAVVDVLLAAGADVGVAQCDESGYEHWALSFASRMGHIHVMNTLLRHGADVLQAGTRGLTALHYAAVRNQAGAVYALVKAGANVEARVDNAGGGGTPLHASSVMRCYDAALALLHSGANVASVNAFGYSPLHGTARQGGRVGVSRMMDLLLRWGADETVVDRDGNRPIDVIGTTNIRAQEGSGHQRGEHESLRKLLANAPADRAWRRRGILVLCRTIFNSNRHRLHCQQHQQQLRLSVDVPTRRRDSLLTGLSVRRRSSKTSDAGNKMWSGLPTTAPQTPRTPAVGAAPGEGGMFDLCEAAGAEEQQLCSLLAREFVEMAEDNDGLRSLLVRLIDIPEEGVFRNAVSFL